MSHGYVKPNADGSKARCGGPTVCPVCAVEFARAAIGALPSKKPNDDEQLLTLLEVLGPDTPGGWRLSQEQAARLVKLAKLGLKMPAAKNALEFYAGRAKDAFWEGNRFIALNHIGEVCTESSGPMVAIDTLDELEKA